MFFTFPFCFCFTVHRIIQNSVFLVAFLAPQATQIHDKNGFD